MDIQMDREVLERILDGRQKPTNLSLTLLQDITGNFSDDREIGHGGFATVYKGVLPNGKVAVKRIRNSHSINEALFYREVSSLLNIEHVNVVRFLGYCASTDEIAIQIEGLKEFIYAEVIERLLCFEYISNGSLTKYITDELRGLEWNTRYEIIRGICEGLCHMHKEKQIYHMDMKPENILLDHDMAPKITDFGLSTLAEKSKPMSEHRLGSLGYSAPEYLFRGKMSFKSDMYSLGVIIIELVTGQKGIPNNNNNVLRRWRHRWKKTGKETQLVYQQLAKCLEIGLLCQEIDPSKRPYIWDVISELDRANGKNSNAYEHTFGQIRPYSEDDMLGIEPLQLHFAFELNKQLSCTLQLINETDSYIAFNIESMCPLSCYTAPQKGIMHPQSKCRVKITLQPLGKTPRDHANELTVWSTKVNGGLAVEDITTSMFLEEAVDVVDEVNLDVVFDASEPQEASDKTSEIKPYLEDDMLGIASLELHFSFDINKQISSLLELTNETDACIAFNIRTTSPLPYCIEPSKDMVPPHSKCSVKITLQYLEKAPGYMQPATFILQSTKVKDGLATEDIGTDMFRPRSEVLQLRASLEAGEELAEREGFKKPASGELAGLRANFRSNVGPAPRIREAGVARYYVECPPEVPREAFSSKLQCHESFSSKLQRHESFSLLPNARPLPREASQRWLHEKLAHLGSGCTSERALSEEAGNVVDEVNLHVVFDAQLQSEFLGVHKIKLPFPFEHDNLNPVVLTHDFLKKITFDFSSNSELGRGGYGVVYKGVFPSGEIIAVKKLFEIHLVKDDQFRNEVSHLTGIKHRNVVQTLGYCAETSWDQIRQPTGRPIWAETPKRLICFEYVPNGSLEKYISDESLDLEWNLRYEIIEGICKGLQFLHEECRIVHLDLKPENILMDALMAPKIADFGLSKIFGDQQTRLIIKDDERQGSIAYMAPEYRINGMVSFRTDIFSLGVIIIQIVTDHREYPLSSAYFKIFDKNHCPLSTETSSKEFTEKVVGKWKKRFASTMKYKPMEKYTQQVKQCITIALSCVDVDMEKRPTVKEIIQVLTRVDQSVTTYIINNQTYNKMVDEEKSKVGLSPMPLLESSACHQNYQEVMKASSELQLITATTTKAQDSPEGDDEHVHLDDGSAEVVISSLRLVDN